MAKMKIFYPVFYDEETGRATKSDEFSEKIQTAFDPLIAQPVPKFGLLPVRY